MKRKVNYFVLSAIFLLLVNNVFAQRQTDIEGGEDYPLISRFEGAVIEFYKVTKWGTYKLPINEEGKFSWKSPLKLEGKVTRIQYSAEPDNNPEYVLQNYKAALKKANFTIVVAMGNDACGRSQDFSNYYYGNAEYTPALNNGKFGLKHHFPAWKNHSFFIAKTNKGDKDIYVAIYIIGRDKLTLITQDVIEVEAPETGMVTATSIDKGIEETGHIAIYDILFAGDKAEIEPESANALRNIAEFLKANADSKYFIVGHAAGIGDFTSGMTLSENRAKAVMSELTAKYGVNENQLEAYGVGSLCPVSSNKSDEGRVKNRRVEIVEH
ncbi:Peptidoglycan-associated lipoprotein [subsurface metagenome]